MVKKSENVEKTLADFSAGIRSFNELTGPLTPDDLDKRREEGKWTVRQIIHHIADAERLWSFAIKAALGNPGCTFDFSWYIADNKWADPLLYHIRGIEPAIGLFRESRTEIVELLTLVPEPWSKHLIIRHDKLPDGRMDFQVIKAVQWQIQHLDIHLTQIRESL